MTRPRSTVPGIELRQRAEVSVPGTDGWQPGTILYSGRTLTVVALDDGSTWNLYGERERRECLRAMSSGQPGDAVADGGQIGRLAVCAGCNGHGTVFEPDADQPDVAPPAPNIADLTEKDYQLLELLERTRDHGGIYLGTLKSYADLATSWPGNAARFGGSVLYRYDRDTKKWWSDTDPQYGLPNLLALTAAGLITWHQHEDLNTLDAQLLEALTYQHGFLDGDGEYRDRNLVVWRPEPMSNPYDEPSEDAKREAVRAALYWLFNNEQPEGAMLSHHGAAFAVTPHRLVNLLARVTDDHASINISVREPVHMVSTTYRNPLAPGELERWAAIVAELGFTAHQLWNGNPSDTGSLCLTEPPHPSVLAAYWLHHQGCTNPDHGRSSGLCGCGWWRDGVDKLIPPNLAFAASWEPPPANPPSTGHDTTQPGKITE